MSGRPPRRPSFSSPSHPPSPPFPLFVLNDQNNYVALPADHPVYTALYSSSSNPLSSSSSFTPSGFFSPEADTPFGLFLADLRSVSWQTVRDLVLRPLITGFAFGIGSYASRYIVHYLMVNYSEYHLPPHSSPQGGRTLSTAGQGEGEGRTSAAKVAADATPEVVAETIAYTATQDMGGIGGGGGGGSMGHDRGFSEALFAHEK